MPVRARRGLLMLLPVTTLHGPKIRSPLIYRLANWRHHNDLWTCEIIVPSHATPLHVGATHVFEKASHKKADEEDAFLMSIARLDRRPREERNSQSCGRNSVARYANAMVLVGNDTLNLRQLVVVTP